MKKNDKKATTLSVKSGRWWPLKSVSFVKIQLRNRPWQRPLTAAAWTSAGRLRLRHAGLDIKTRAHDGFNIIHFNGFNVFKKFLFYDEGKVSVIKYFVTISWLIQSQAQRGPGSAPLGEHHPDGRYNIPVFQKILYHFTCFLSNFKHICLLVGIFLCYENKL